MVLAYEELRTRAAGTQAAILAAMASKKPKVVQRRNPRSGHYVKIDRAKGTIISHKATKGPYKGVPIARKKAR